MKSPYLLLLFTALFLFSCGSDDDDNNDNNPPVGQTPSFTGTLNDLVNGPSTNFSADVINVHHDTHNNQLFVYLEQSGGQSLGFTIDGIAAGQYFLSGSSASLGYFVSCNNPPADLSTRPNDSAIVSDLLGVLNIDSYNEATGKLNITISSLSFYSVGNGDNDDELARSLTDATLQNADVEKVAVAINYLAKKSVNALVDGERFDPSSVSFGNFEIATSLYAKGSQGVLELSMPLSPEAGVYDLSEPGSGYVLAYNVNDLNIFSATSGTLVVVESCGGQFYGTFNGIVPIDGQDAEITEGHYAFDAE